MGTTYEPSELERQLQGYSLATAHILYHMPDHPGLLQTFIWQTYDLAPEFPAIRKFIGFWKESIEARLHSIEVAHRKLIGPGEWRNALSTLSLH
ncbi:MAG: usg protein [Hyphomicrobiaceae bacterium]|nr:usg protein [Hyphomicrobiaceae bacterium]